MDQSGVGGEVASEVAAGGMHYSSTCPFGHWPPHKSGQDGPMCAQYCIICLLNSLLENCNLRPTKEFESPYFIETPKMKYLERPALGSQTPLTAIVLALDLWASKTT